MPNGRFIAYENNLAATSTGKTTSWHAVGDLEELLVHVSGNVSSSDASTPTLTVDLYTGSADYGFSQNLSGIGSAIKVFTGTLVGAVGGASTPVSLLESFGHGMVNNISFGNIVAVELTMTANGNFAGLVDWQGK